MELESDPVWTDRYERQREQIETQTDPRAVFHVGSTAIPEVAGQPQLDVLAVYDDDAAMREAADTLEAAGEKWGRTDAGETIVVYWRDPPEAVYLKLRVAGDEAIAHQLAFRNYLRDHESARREYEAAKREAAAHDSFQPYQEAKLETVSTLNERAREAGYYDALPDSIRE